MSPNPAPLPRPNGGAPGAARDSAGAAARRYRVFLVEDHPIVREGLAQLVNDEPDLVTCGAAADAATALREIERTSPDIAVVDLLLGDDDGLELVRTLKARFPQMPALVLSMYKESLYAERALRAGARGYVTKLAPTDSVLVAIRRVLAGDIYVSEATATRLMSKLVGGAEAVESNPDPDAPPDLSRLSDREFEVFRLMGRGVGPSEIATRLGVSVKTVETYQDHLKRKLKVPSARDLWRLASAHAADPGAAARHGGRRPGTDPV